MQRVQASLDRISQVREAASDINSAYIFRTRVHRMLLSVQRLVAQEYGVNVTAPRVLDPSLNVDPGFKELALLTTDLVLSTRHLSQNSVALSERWAKEWSRVEIQLARLESILVGLLISRS